MKILNFYDERRLEEVAEVLTEKRIDFKVDYSTLQMTMTEKEYQWATLHLNDEDYKLAEFNGSKVA